MKDQDYWYVHDQKVLQRSEMKKGKKKYLTTPTGLEPVRANPKDTLEDVLVFRLNHSAKVSGYHGKERSIWLYIVIKYQIA